MSRRRPKVQRKIRSMVLERDGYCCINCGNPDHLTMDHLVPLSRGGRNHSSNLGTFCDPCNHLKGDLTMDEFADKLAVV